MVESVPRQPSDVWVRAAAMMVRGGLSKDGLISSDDAVAWLVALETAALDALHALDHIHTILADVTSDPAAPHPTPSTTDADEGRHRFRALGTPSPHKTPGAPDDASPGD